MNEQQIRLKLSRFPGDKLVKVAIQLKGVADGVYTKTEAVDYLAGKILAGRYTLDQVINLIDLVKTPASAPSAPAVADPALADKVDNALVQIQDRLKAAELKAQAAVEKAEREVQAKLAGVKSADSSLIGETIRAEVAKVFAPFKQDASPDVLAEVASRLPSFRLERAGDIFPVTAYGNVDFGDLQVGIWSDPQAPALVDDYVFNPAHLHQALIALDDQLPDNVWLAGERGTGKTEFVSQLAARLQRKLVRVNFDEALERADFIGANTIAGGDVVWAEGIITKAIQHPGALILLDEVGFARAQSISVLHALTERSVHRALTIAETGARIPVASHVAFFAADNSNGHGDSGNFAGVREQNTAFLDRFGFTLRFEYLPARDEADLICKRTGLTPKAAKILVDFARAARQHASQGLLTQPPSLRQLFAWARAVAKGLPVDVAFKNAVINKFPSDCEAELEALYAAKVNEVELKEALLMLGINLKTGVEATLVRLNAHSQGRHLRNLAFVWGHNTAAISESARGVTVYFPAIDEAKAVPQGLLHRLVGYACHELGHHWFTNNQDWEAVAGNDPWLHSLINGLEDPRIEQAVIDSGFAGNSRNLFQGLVNHVVKGEVPIDYDNIPFILAVEGRRLNGYNILAPQTYQNTPWAADLEWALTEAHKAQDTYTITRIALELAVRLNRYEKEGPEGNPGKDGGNPGEGKEGEGQPGDDTTEGQPGEGQPGDGEGQDGEGEGQGNGQPGDGQGQGQGRGEGQEQGKGTGHGGVHQGPINNDPTSWINEEMADHQTEAQLDGKVGHIVQPTFHKFD